MSKPTYRLQLTREELLIIQDLASKELIKDITHQRLDPNLISIVQKLAVLLHPKDMDSGDV